MKYAALVYSHKEINTKYLYNYDISEELLKNRGIEYIILRTCNRVELYVSSDNADSDLNRLLNELSVLDKKYEKGTKYFGKEAVNHIFSVAAGLDSMLLGENEILGQVKKAYMEAYKSETMNENLSHLFKNAVNAGKTARNKTNINKGKTGIYSLAIDYIENNRLNEEIAIVGSGEETKRFLNGLSTKGTVKGKVFSREITHAKKLADIYGMDYDSFNLEAIEKYNVIFCAYKNEKPYTLNKPLAVIDISVPHVFEGENVLHLEDIIKISDYNLGKKEEEVKKARELISCMTNSFIERYGE